MKFYDNEIPTKLIKHLPLLFNMPDKLMAEIVYETNTLEERERSIFFHCLFFYITKKYQLKSYAEFVKKMNKNTDDKMADFIEEIVRRIITKNAE
jgi:hypothetical protein